MGVVVVHRYATAGADELEAAVDALEPRERRLCSGSVDADPHERLERRGRVPAVVLSGNGQVEPDRRQLPAANDVRYLGQPPVDRLGELGARAVGAEMIELDVRDDGEPRPQRERGPVGLVAFDDEPAGPGTGVPAMRSRCAVETTASNPSGGAGSPPRTTSIPSRVSLKIVSCASHPRTSAPSARATFA